MSRMEEMKKTVEEGLPEEMFTDLRGYECGPGWVPLIRTFYLGVFDLFDLAIRAEQLKGGAFRMVQVKEKFGFLRMYYDMKEVAEREASAIHALDRFAERLSGQMCEECGAPGDRNGPGYWIRTLCPVHREANNARLLQGT